MGGRLFNIWYAAESKQVDISRLPAFGKIRHNDVLVFNFPYPGRWDSLGLNLKRYYVKRCVAIPGDTFEIRDACFRVRGYNMELGNVDSQKKLRHILALKQESDNGIVMEAFPRDSAIAWDIKEFGPLYIPAKGTSIKLNVINVRLYRNVIEWEQRKKLIQKNGLIFLGDSMIENYQFNEDYYFVAGDKVTDSKDSRYWGLLPKKFIVGKATLIWKSIDPVTDKIRWNRILKKIK